MPAKTIEEEVILGPNNYVNLVSQANKQGIEISLISQIQYARLEYEKRPKPERKGLVNKFFWAGDGTGYGLQEEDVVFYHTDAANNPGLENPEEFRRQVTGSDHAFFLDPAKSSTLEAKANDLGDSSIVAFNISELKREGILKEYENNREFVYVEVSTGVLTQGKKAFRKEYGQKITDLFDRVESKAIYGKNGIGAKLKQRGKSTTRIYFPNPDHIRNQLAQKEKGTTLWRASYVSSFGSSSDVGLGGWSLDDSDRHLRGVVRESAEGGATKTSPLETLAGKGYVAHGDVAVVKQSDVSPEAWALLTQKK